ncbi:MAG: InlB B-repeat-containing protein [Clostridia bacterium]|nr:InlB B-repeat-containing protein [Clostridia bacterium]
MKKIFRCLVTCLTLAVAAQSFACADFFSLSGSEYGDGGLDIETELGSSGTGSSDAGAPDLDNSSGANHSGNSGNSGSDSDDVLIQFVQTYDVTFVYNNGADSDTVKTLEGERVLEPKSPELADYDFTGWYVDESWTVEYNFSLPVTADITLYAGYEAEGQHAVRFVYGDGRVDSVFVTDGDRVKTPARPEKENHIFTGWYTDETLTVEYDFSAPVETGISLYAAYQLDGCAITNEITKNTIKSVVKIYNKAYNQNIFGGITSSSTSQGSGFCFHVQSGGQGEYYYVLTNSHVAYKDPAYAYQQFTIIDYQGKEYAGKLYSNSEKMGDAIAASYDLACLYFTATDTNVQKLEMEKVNAVVGDDVIALGAPLSQSNAITFGKAVRYQTLTLTNGNEAESNVRFPVLRSNAYCDNGSSGGPAVNADLSVIGVVYAGNESTGDSFIVPIEKVREFLNLYVYN